MHVNRAPAAGHTRPLRCPDCPAIPRWVLFISKVSRGRWPRASKRHQCRSLGEFGHPPKEHLDAFYLCQRESFNITIHSGEAFGVPSIWQALQYCGAHRIGHGTRLIEDMVIQNDEVLRMGRLAQYVLDHRIPLEICLSSNVQTGAVASLDEHPFRYLLRHNFRITLNTDNRLMSGTTCTEEHWLAHQHFGVDLKGDGLEQCQGMFVRETSRPRSSG